MNLRSQHRLLVVIAFMFVNSLAAQVNQSAQTTAPGASNSSLSELFEVRSEGDFPWPAVQTESLIRYEPQTRVGEETATGSTRSGGQIYDVFRRSWLLWRDRWADSALSYALGEPSVSDQNARYETLVHVIESSATTGRTRSHLPGVDAEKFPPSKLVSESDVDHWSFERLQTIKPPTMDDAVYRIRNPIDAFVAKELKRKGLPQNSPAKASDLARRVYYDTTGLPPTWQQLAAWNRDSKKDGAYEQSVEKLLSDKAFGEKWARLWLDLARYADSDGYEEDDFRPRAFTYRDFTTWAMNSDLSYKLFIQWQIAGDQLEPQNPMAVAATGFVVGSPINIFFPQESERMDELDDIVSTMGRSMLGLTIGCARCHEHRYDPIPTEDYYQLVAVFKNTERKRVYLLPDGGEAYRATTDCVTEKRAEMLDMLLESLKEKNIEKLSHFTEAEKALLRQPIDESNEEQARLLSKCMRCLLVKVEQLDHKMRVDGKYVDRYFDLKAAIDELAPDMPPPAPQGLCVTGGKPTGFHVLKNGDLKRAGAPVNPGFLTALTTSQPEWTEDLWREWSPSDAEKDDLYPRTALAVWLTDTENGGGALLARVIVNRIWQQYFDRGIVSTPSDFGMLGEYPSHPELLEWLASELVANDWSLRHIHRLILHSASYRQSCDDSEKSRKLDPKNEYVWRQNPKRLSAEMLRDSFLVVGGNLNRKMYGPAIVPSIPRAAILNTSDTVEMTWPMLKPDDPASFRRSLYITTKRSMAVPLMKLFDAPDGSNSCEIRTTTTVPTQALALLNSRFVRDQAQRTAGKISSKFVGNTAGDLVVVAYRRILLRDPTADEVLKCLAFCRSVALGKTQEQVLGELCQVLMLTNEFTYLN